MRPESRLARWESALGMPLPLFPVFVLLVLLLGGGIYSWPAIRLSRGRDPVLTILLGLGLTVTATLIGVLSGAPGERIGLLVGGAWGLLLLRRAVGRLDRNLEHFMPVHAITVIGAIVFSATTAADTG